MKNFATETKAFFTKEEKINKLNKVYASLIKRFHQKKYTIMAEVVDSMKIKQTQT